MEITFHRTGEELEIKLCGRLDASWSELVVGTLAECMRKGEHHIVIDMAKVTYISSAGIRVLMQAYKQLRAIDGSFRVAYPSDAVRSTLSLSGLTMIFEACATPEVPLGKKETSKEVCRLIAGCPVEVYDESNRSKVKVRLVGNPQCLGSTAAEGAATLSADEMTIAVGFGALGGGREVPETFGEFLAVGGAACFLDGTNSSKADYLVKQEDFIPSAWLAQGIIGQGEFSFHFGFNDEHPLSVIVRLALELCAARGCALAMIAETAQLVGAAVRKWQEEEWLSFPAIKDTIGFTTEPTHYETVTLLTGFAALDAQVCPTHMRPLVPQHDLFGHFHAVVFPYAPLQRGKLELTASVRNLFSVQAPRAMLHLINDWRNCVGSGESRFVRGSCWCAPLHLEDLGG
jgi:anti-anti-sigma factor